MFVGEGPGADEDAQGLPFVGRAGQLLNNMIAAMGLKREEVYIANVVKCRPPQNRVPEPDEAHTCCSSSSSRSRWFTRRCWWRWVRPPQRICWAKNSLSARCAAGYMLSRHQADRDLSSGVPAARSAAEERGVAGPADSDGANWGSSRPRLRR